jgi:hypothetical protein
METERKRGQFQGNAQYSNSHQSEHCGCPDTALDVNIQTENCYIHFRKSNDLLLFIYPLSRLIGTLNRTLQMDKANTT